MNSIANRNTPIPALDGIRGIAALAVVVFHCGLVSGFNLFTWSPLARWGWAGVEMFFVLSGFLITGILLRTRDDEHYWRNFLARRALRIFPAYYFSLAVIWLLFPIVSADFAESSVRHQFGYFLFYLQNWTMAFNGWPDWPYIAHFWSLAVEEQFYLVWPLLVLLLSTPHRIARVSLVLVVLSLAFKAAIGPIDTTGLISYIATVSQLYALCAGALLACLSREWLDATLKVRWKTMALVALLIASWFIALHIFIVALTCLAIAATITDRSPYIVRYVLESRWLRWFGKYSYGIYLIHYPLLGLILEYHGASLETAMQSNPNLAALSLTLLVVALTAALALVQFQLVEQPFLKAKRFFDSGGTVKPSSTTRDA